MSTETRPTPAQQSTAAATDIARCPGVGFEDPDVPGGIDWREGCEDCQRRTSPPPNPERALQMTPPPIIAIWCEHHIHPQEQP